MIAYLLLIVIFTEDEFRELKKGNNKLVERLYREYKDRIYNFLVLKLNGNRETAAEILSDTFVKVYDALPHLQNQDNLSAWLIGISINRLRIFSRKNRYHKKIVEFRRDCEPAVAEEFIDGIEKKYKYSLIRLAMDTIKPVYKDILFMRYIKEMSQNEIAKAMNKTEGSVESLLVRAKNKLRQAINALDESYCGSMGE